MCRSTPNIFSAAYDLDQQIKYQATTPRSEYTKSYPTGRTAASSGLVPSTVTDVEPLIRQSIQDIFGHPVPLASTPFPLPDNWFVLAEDPETLNNILTASKIYLLQRKKPQEEVPQGRKVPDLPKTNAYTKPSTNAAYTKPTTTKATTTTTTTTTTSTTTTNRPPPTRPEPNIVTAKDADLWVNSINPYVSSPPKMENDFKPMEFKPSALLSMNKGPEPVPSPPPVYYKPTTQAPVKVLYASTAQPAPKVIPQAPISNTIYNTPIKPLPLATVKPIIPRPPPQLMPKPDMFIRPPPVNQYPAPSATVVSNYPQNVPIQQVNCLTITIFKTFKQIHCLHRYSQTYPAHQRHLHHQVCNSTPLTRRLNPQLNLTHRSK